MTHFLEKTLSQKRLATYQRLSENDRSGRSAEDLYALNVQYSKEIYVVLSGLEISVRNGFHEALQASFGKKEWWSLELLKPKHKEQLDQATQHVARVTKDNYILDDVIAQLSFGFWVHFLTRPYEKTIWNKALYKCFPYLGQKPHRSDLYQRLIRAVTLRNKIAHFEPIIKNEDTLIQDYRNILEMSYAICPHTQEWFEKLCNFEEIWNNRNKGDMS